MVLTHDTDAAIQRAKIRATARNIQATQVDVAAAGYDRTVYYECGAFSHAGSHRVALHYSADGVTATCDCEAGQSDLVCQHVAAALMAEEAPQEPEPSIVEQLGANFISRMMDPDRAERRVVPIRPHVTTNADRLILALIGPGFWTEDGAIGVVDGGNQDEVHARLRRAAELLGYAGYTVRRERHEDRIARLHIVDSCERMISN